MMTDHTEELLPCPFCGSSAIEIHRMPELFDAPDSAQCADCMATAHLDGWNRRATTAPEVRQEAVAIANRGKCAFWVKWTEAAEGLYGPGIKLYTTPQPGQDVRALVEALNAADEYLSDNPFNEIGSGSILHRQMKDALRNSRQDT